MRSPTGGRAEALIVVVSIESSTLGLQAGSISYVLALSKLLRSTCDCNYETF